MKHISIIYYQKIKIIKTDTIDKCTNSCLKVKALIFNKINILYKVSNNNKTLVK